MAEKLAIGISGAPGTPIAIALLKELRRSDIGTYLIISRGGGLTIDQGTGYGLEEMKRLAGMVYNNQDLDASLVNGSSKTLGTVMVPYSTRTLAEIHSGYSNSLLFRAADVTMKEWRGLVLVARECPLNPIHLRNMYELSQVDAIILSSVTSHYQRPETIGEMIIHVVGKMMDQFGLECQSFQCWEG